MAERRTESGVARSNRAVQSAGTKPGPLASKIAGAAWKDTRSHKGMTGTDQEPISRPLRRCGPVGKPVSSPASSNVLS